MYHEIHRLSMLGFSNAKIAQFLVIDARTVSKYLSMDEQGYEQHLSRSCHRKKALSPYEDFVFEKLSEFEDTSSAQIHDWLKEAHPDFPEVSPRTVYNFVMFVRQAHNIPHVRSYREYFPVEELPYGEQAQVDFGEYNMRQSDGKRKKVKFFAMVLSRSRMKYTWFLDKPFTAETVVLAHEKAFGFFGGATKTIVYDQDRTIVVDENLGDVILTDTFKQYTKSRSFKLHFCRKADPESKGKVENVVQYVKKNFLYNRLYLDLETLNTEALAWLGRTANHLPHNYTKKSPESEFMIEKQHLAPFSPLTIENKESSNYSVRKTNAINYKSNFYTVPVGTYQGPGTYVSVKEKNSSIEIRSLGGELICTHPLSCSKGKTISNTNHKRDASKSLKDMMQQTASCFTDHGLAMDYIRRVKQEYPRYIRDHLQAILKATAGADKEAADKTMSFCMQNNVFSGNEWERVLQVLQDVPKSPKPENEIGLLDKSNLEKAGQVPQTSNIQDYEDIINQ